MIIARNAAPQPHAWKIAVVAVLVLVGCGDDPARPVNPTPGIEALSPTEIDAGTEGLTLTVSGSDFVQGSKVRLDGADRPTQFESGTQLRVTLSAADLMTSGVRQITVFNEAPGGGVSNAMPFLVRVRVNQVPTVTAITPPHLTAGSSGIAITVSGSGFIEESRVLVDFEQRPTTYVSPTELRATLTDADAAGGGTLAIRVASPSPGGGVSNAVNLEVRSPVPTLSSLATQQTFAGQQSFTLRVHGTGIVANSQVLFSGAPRNTQLVEAGTLEAMLEEGDLRVAGTYPITVTNPAPGGGTSNALDLVLTNGAPEIVLLPSQGAAAGGSGFDLFVHGTAFVDGTVVRWNGFDRPTQYISGTRVSAAISGSDIAAAGTAQVSVHNPAPGGGTSSSWTFHVRSVGPPTVTSSRIVDIRAADLSYDPQRQRLYLSIPGGTSPNSNSIVALDPMTGDITGSVFVGSEPDRLARSDNGQYLYVGLNGASAVRRVELASLSAGLQWSLPAGQIAGELEVAPGRPNVVLVSRHSPGLSPSLQGVTVYDAGVARSVSSPGHTGGSRIEFLESPDVIYGFNNAHTGFEFFTIAIEPSGARHATTTGGLISGHYTHIVGAGGRIYGTDGSVVDAERHVRVGSFGLNAAALAVDPSAGRLFVLMDSGITVYDLNTYQQLGTIDIPEISFPHPALANTRLVRWGTDGLAFLDQDRLFLIRSPIIAP